MSLLRTILANRKTNELIPFGIHPYVRLIEVDNKQRTRDGQVQARNTYLSFNQYEIENEKEVVKATRTFSFYDLDHNDKEDKIVENLMVQIEQLQSIITAYELDTQLDPVADYDSEEELFDDLKTKKGCKSLTNTLYKQFEKAIKDKIGNKSNFIYLKVTYNAKGIHLKLPYSGPVAEKFHEGEEPALLSFSAYEKKCKERGENPQKESADGVGSKPSKSLADI